MAATHHPGGSRPGADIYWPWNLLLLFLVAVVVVGFLVAFAGYGWRGGNEQYQAQQMMQGEQPVQADAAAGSPAGPAPANKESDPLKR